MDEGVARAGAAGAIGEHVALVDAAGALGEYVALVGATRAVGEHIMSATGCPPSGTVAASMAASKVFVDVMGDSPWSFVDVAPRLAEQGYLVRTVLLPGHDTTPSDLLEVSLEDWQRVVREQVAALRSDVAEVYLGGFSTGANLVTAYALRDEAVAGLLLYSPAFRSGNRYEWLAPWLALVRALAAQAGVMLGVLEADGAGLSRNDRY